MTLQKISKSRKIPTLMKYLRTSFGIVIKQAVLDEQLRGYFDKEISERQKKLDGGILCKDKKRCYGKNKSLTSYFCAHCARSSEFLRN